MTYNSEKTKAQLAEEVTALQQRVAELEQAAIEKDRKLTALKDWTEILQAVLTGPADFWALLDAQGTLLALSETIAHGAGKSVAELTGRCGYDIVPPDQAKKGKVHIDKVFRSGQPSRFQYKRDDLWLDVLVKPATWQAGKVTQVAILARNVTPYKQTEIALQESQIWYHGLFHDSPISLWQADFSAVKDYLDRVPAESEAALNSYFDQHPDQVIHCFNLVRVGDVNQATLKLFQAEHKHEILANWNHLFDPELPGVFQEQVVAVAQGQTRFETEVSAQTLTGARIFVKLVWSVAKGHEARYDQVLVSLIDMTEHRHTEEAYRALVDDSLQGLAILQEEGIVFANAAMARIAGYPIEELLSMSVEALDQTIYPKDREFFVRRRERWLAGKPLPDRYEMQIIRKDGSVRWVERFGTPITYRGRPALQIGVLDITERKEAEETLQRYNRELILLNQATQTFATLLDIDDLLPKVLEGVGSLLEAQGYLIWLVDQETDELVCRAVIGPGEDYLAGWRLQPGEGVAGWVARANQHLLVWNIQEDKAYYKGTEPLTGLEVRSIFNLPLRVKGQVIGVLQATDESPERFKAEDVRLVGPLAAAASIAIHNARLYRTAQQVDHLQLLTELDRALSATLELEAVAEVMLQHMSVALDAPVSVIWLFSIRPEIQADRFFTRDRGWKTDEQQQGRAHLLKQKREPVSRERWALLWDRLSDEDVRQWQADGLLVPIPVKEKPVAAVLLGGRPDYRPFTGGDQLLAQSIASHGAQAFENARLYQASQERSAYLAALHAISKTVVSSLELQTVLRRVLQLTCQTLEATEGFILLLEQASDSLLVAMTLTDKTEHLRGQRLASGQGIASVVVKRGTPVRIADVQQQSRFETDLDEMTGLETRSVLCVPLIYRSHIIGAIEVINNRQNKFGQEDLNLLMAVASFAAIALQNAHLYTASQARADELAILNEIGLALTSTLDYKAVVELALSLIRGLFRASRSVLYSLDPRTGQLDSAAMQTTPDDDEMLNVPAQSLVADQVARSVWKQRRSILVENTLDESWLQELVPNFKTEPSRSLMAVPLFVSGQPIGVLVVLNDEVKAYGLDDLQTLYSISTILAMTLQNAQLYTRQKDLLEQQAKAQAHLIRAEKMVALGRLAAAIMHEINNPLQAVRGFLELAHKEVSGQEQSGSLDRYLAIANEEVVRISTMARRLYDFYSPPSKEMRQTDLQIALTSVLALTNKELQRNQITVDRREGPALPLVEGRPDQVRQVFLNLVLNAIDAMPDGGTLQINSALLNAADEPMVSVEFSDTGRGMSEETRARLFEPFFTTKSEGSGLGLSISYSIIQAHRGQISVVSHEGLGTTFTVLLPVKQPLE